MNHEDKNLTPDQQRELDAFEAAFNGHPVDAELNDLAVLATALESATPKMTSGFASNLDRRVADRFPAHWVSEKPDSRPWTDRLRARFANGRSLLLPVTAGFAGVLVVGTLITIGVNSSGLDSGSSDNSSQNASILDSSAPSDDTSASSSDSASSSAGGIATPDAPTAKELSTLEPDSGKSSADGSNAQGSSVVPNSGAIFQQNGSSAGAELKSSQDQSSAGGAAAGINPFSDDGKVTSPNSGSAGKYAAGVNKRAVAHKTEIVLGTNAEGVQDVSNKITSVVDSHNGIVLDSNVEDGPEGVAGASFRLLIPTAQLESAVGDLSQVADLRSRTQQATDITAPTLTVEDKLAEAHAEAQSLVKELSEATTDEDRASIKAELADQRAKVSRLTTKSNRLSRRASLTPVSVDVQTGEQFGQADDSKWGPGDALHDIGGFLGTAAGVALIVLAVVIPLALLALLIALINRAWVRTSRRRVLDSSDS